MMPTEVQKLQMSTTWRQLRSKSYSWAPTDANWGPTDATEVQMMPNEVQKLQLSTNWGQTEDTLGRAQKRHHNYLSFPY